GTLRVQSQFCVGPVPGTVPRTWLAGPRPGRSVVTSGSADRKDEQSDDCDRHEPPDADVVVRDEGRHRERDHEPRRDEPVVADDEVPPETGEGDDVLHAPAGARRCRRSSWTSASETRT